MKRDGNFRMRKTTKTLLSRILDKGQRDYFKNMMIDAQISETEPPKKEKKAPGVVIGGIEVDA